jgi:hypothetical protein
MHQAPAVGFSVGKSRWHWRAIITLWSLGFAVLLVFIRNQALIGTQAVVAVCWLLAGIGSLKGWQNSPSGRLQWDGRQWQWSAWVDAPAVRLDLLLDFQSVMLVGLTTNAQRRVWLWLEPTSDHRQWIALRRAVVGSQGLSDGGVAVDLPAQVGEGP